MNRGQLLAATWQVVNVIGITVGSRCDEGKVDMLGRHGQKESHRELAVFAAISWEARAPPIVAIAVPIVVAGRRITEFCTRGPIIATVTGAILLFDLAILTRISREANAGAVNRIAVPIVVAGTLRGACLHAVWAVRATCTSCLGDIAVWPRPTRIACALSIRIAETLVAARVGILTENIARLTIVPTVAH